MAAGVFFKANSTLGAVLVITLMAWLGGVAMGEAGKGIVGVASPIFIIVFAVWLIFIFLSIARNFKKF
jgi:hypothetical protein